MGGGNCDRGRYDGAGESRCQMTPHMKSLIARTPGHRSPSHGQMERHTKIFLVVDAKTEIPARRLHHLVQGKTRERGSIDGTGESRNLSAPHIKWLFTLNGSSYLRQTRDRKAMYKIHKKNKKKQIRDIKGCKENTSKIVIKTKSKIDVQKNT